MNEKLVARMQSPNPKKILGLDGGGNPRGDHCGNAGRNRNLAAA